MEDTQRINRRQAAELLGVTTQSVANLVARGALNVTKVGQWSYFSREEVLALIPKADAVREAEKAIDEVVAELEKERAMRVTEAMVFKARREFIERLTDVSTFHRYQQLVGSVYDAVEKSAMLGEKMTTRERDIIDEIIHLRPLGEIAARYGLSENRIRQIFERALRRMVHFATEIGASFDRLSGALAAAEEERDRLAAEVTKLRAGHTEAASTKALLERPIGDFDLSVRARNCLRAMGVECLRDIIVRERHAVLRCRNLGAKSIAEIDRLLMNCGFHYGTTEKELNEYYKTTNEK